MSSASVNVNQPLPGHPGALVSRSKGLPGDKFLYTSRKENGQIVPVSGNIFEHPLARGTVILAPGTRGMGDHCADANYDLAVAVALQAAGYRVVTTDYMGLGTPGIHSYMNRVDQGRAVIDAARATTRPGQKVFFYGYSQGGAAAAAAAELKPSYAPEVNLVGTFAGAPPADLIAVMRQGNDAALEPVSAFTTAGFYFNDPEFRRALDAKITPQGRDFLNKSAHSCLWDQNLNRYGRLRDYTYDRKPLHEIAGRNPGVHNVLARQRLGTVRVDSPILIVSAVNDRVVPHGQAAQLARDYKAKGSPHVEFRAVHGPAGAAEITHFSTSVKELPQVIAWMNARFR